MRRVMRLVSVLLSLVLVASVAQAATAPKAGSACKKAGQTITAGGKKYTCVKSGKKLVWSKGVTVVVPTPIPSVTPTPSATPTPTPTPTVTPTQTPEPKPLVAGDPCSTIGNTINNAQGYLECRDVANNQKKYFQLSNSISDLAAQSSPLPFTTCRVPDFRTNVGKWDYATAYPIARVPVEKSNLNIIYIPFDFPDHPGTGNPKDLYPEDFTKFKEWLKWYSNGKKTAEMTTFDKWIRSSRPSTDYVPHFWHTNNNMSVGVEMILKDVENLIDLSKIDVIYLVFPKDLQTIKEPSGGRYEIMTNKGRLSFNMYTTGMQSFHQKGALWFDLTHELLHQAWGIQQHAPAYPVMLNVSTGTPGPGQSLLTWDAMTLDWAKQEELWCTDIKSLSSAEVTLVPMEREQKGVRAAMINLAPSRTLIIESHRKDKWGNYNAGTYGLTAYIVDTRFATDRSGEGNGTDDFKGTKYTRAANFIEFPLNHGQYKMEWWDYLTGKSYGIVPQFSLNYFLYEGESFTFENVTVKLAKSGDNDTIQITKN
jgi:hypothetical protein